MTLSGILSFTYSVVHLTSFPLFCLYLLMVWLNPWYKKVSKPLHLQSILVIYNFTCSFLNAATLCGFCYCMLTSDDLFSKEDDAFLKKFFFLYWITKVLELMDTLFMILRHKERQITFLHVYHHGSMLLLMDYSYHYAPWLCIVPIIGLNSLVHVALYLYYGLTALRPDNSPQWKKKLTQMQIAQFVIDLFYAFWGYMYHGFCIYGIFYGFVMTGLFCNFYYHAYMKVRPSSKVRNQTQNGVYNDKVHVH